MPRFAPPAVPFPLSRDHVRLAAGAGGDEAVARWQALLDAGRIGAPPPAERPDYRKLDRLFGLDRVGRW